MKLDPPTLRLVVTAAAVLLLIVVLAGAVVTIVNQRELSFHDYLSDLTILGTALIAAVGAAIFKMTAGAKKDDGE